LGVLLTIISGSDTSFALPTLNTLDPHGADAEVKIPGGELHLVDINPKDNVVQFMRHPEVQPLIAAIELSTKPMINLVWIGFLGIVAGAIVAFYRRITEGKK
jgi:hypothetical protein